MTKKQANNYAFIDGQNLHMGTSKKLIDPWSIDLAKLRIYLKDKYKIKIAYYYLGHKQENSKTLYGNIEQAGFILVFKKHNESMLSSKKGNVDSDIIFSIMKKIYKKEIENKIVLVSGDGDYKDVVDFLIEEKVFLKLLMPDIKRGSSLYKKLGGQYYAGLDTFKSILEYKNKKGS